MVRRARRDRHRGIAVAMGLFACAALSGCGDESPYTDDLDFPQATYYTVVVRPGDTLTEISKRYDTTVVDVAELNRLGDGSRIHAGQTLRVPANGRGTHDAVLGEAGNASMHNYAPSPRPIDVARFDPHDHVAPRNPEVSAQEKPQQSNMVADEEAARPNSVENPTSRPADASPHASGRFVWPVSGQVISPFGSVGRGERNDGINIATAAGTPIHAAAAGTVTYAGNELKGYGNLVLIQHGDGYVTAYAHAGSITVSRGDRVDRGQVIGLSGATGDVDRPQLHFEIRKGVQPINPRLLLASKD
jgi:murein DD-endopeptidase MepM/ murein hydrolase activator NlpD